MFSLKKLSPTITDMIRFDHSHVLVSFHQYTADATPKVARSSKSPKTRDQRPVVIVLFILFILLGCFVSVWFFHVIGFLLFFLILSVIA